MVKLPPSFKVVMPVPLLPFPVTLFVPVTATFGSVLAGLTVTVPVPFRVTVPLAGIAAAV